MQFLAKKKNVFVSAGILFAAIVFFVHQGYADKSDIPSDDSKPAFEAPMDLTDKTQTDEDIQMFEERSVLDTQSANEKKPLPTKEIEGSDSFLSGIKKRWSDGEKFRETMDEFKPSKYENDLVVRTQSDQDYFFTLELALHPQEQSRGLMGRKSMPKMHGMLFVFHSMAQRSFWMKNTLIPLDIIFIDNTGRIGHIHHNAKPLDESMISSNGPAWAVLEINGGMALELDIQEGDKILHTAFKNRHME